MAYESGTATSQHDLLDKLRVFAVAAGWTQDGYSADGTGYRLHLHKGSLYFALRSAADEQVLDAYYFGAGYTKVTGIALTGATGYNGGADWDEQPGAPITNTSNRSWGVCITQVSGAIPAYYLFTLGANAICLVAEYESGKFQWLVFGELDKSAAGTYTGGAFFAASHSAAIASSGFSLTAGPFGFGGDAVNYATAGVLLDVDSVAEDWWPAAQNYDTSGSPIRVVHCNGISKWQYTTQISPTSQYQYGLAAPLIRSTPNAFNALTPLFPIYVTAERASSRFSFIGEIPNIRQCNIFNHDAADEIALGADTWKVFPNHSKIDTYPETGFAVLKVI
jgi:hypothetical protein